MRLRHFNRVKAAENVEREIALKLLFSLSFFLTAFSKKQYYFLETILLFMRAHAQIYEAISLLILATNKQ